MTDSLEEKKTSSAEIGLLHKQLRQLLTRSSHYVREKLQLIVQQRCVEGDQEFRKAQAIKHEQILEKEQKIQGLSKELTKIQERALLQQEKKKLEQEVETQISPAYVLYKQMKPLFARYCDIEQDLKMTQDQKRKVLCELIQVILSLLDPKMAPVPQIDQDLCIECSKPLRIQPSTSEAICTNRSCAIVHKLLYSSSNSMPMENTMETQQNNYKRGANYRKWLEQFSVDAPPIPDSLLEAIKSYLLPEYDLRLGDIRATKIQNILGQMRKTEWNPYAYKISKILSSSPTPVFDHARIRRLLDRHQVFERGYQIYISESSHATTDKSRQKFPKSEIITHMFCYEEGWEQEARMFSKLKFAEVNHDTNFIYFMVKYFIDKHPDAELSGIPWSDHYQMP